VGPAFEGLRAFLYRNVYENYVTHAEFVKSAKILTELYGYFMENPQEASREYSPGTTGEEDKGRLVCDFVAGMTDRYALKLYEDIFLPKPWGVI